MTAQNRPPFYFICAYPSSQNSRTDIKNHKNQRKKFAVSKTIPIFAIPNHNGTMAEWLGSGLQNRVQQFDSAWYLKEGDSIELPSFFSSCRAPSNFKTASPAFLREPRGIGHLCGRMLQGLCCLYQELLLLCLF